MNAGSALGFVIFIIGVILFIGNITGWWATFPFAGYLTMLVGGIISKLARE